MLMTKYPELFLSSVLVKYDDDVHWLFALPPYETPSFHYRNTREPLMTGRLPGCCPQGKILQEQRNSTIWSGHNEAPHANIGGKKGRSEQRLLSQDPPFVQLRS